jgi:hypothetical protein
VISRLALIATCSLLIGGCSMPRIWPFHKKPKPAPEVVHELDLVNADGTPSSFPQYWKRNTLVIDLSGASGTGTVAARLPPNGTWPVRVAVRVQPGSVEQLEIIGEERNVLAVSREATLPLDLEFEPSVYRPGTGSIYISWGPMPKFAEAAGEAAPEFVSPTQVPGRAPAAAPAPGPAASPAEDSTEEPAPSASDIVAPGEAAGAQPQPSPGS